MRLAAAALVLLSVATNSSAQSPDSAFLALHSTSRKLVVVVTADWNALQGTLERYERRNGKWQKVGDTISVVVGRSGLAWDPRRAREHSLVSSGPIKHEGDGRSPAGLFLLKNTFGFAAALAGVDSYLPITSTTECVDDPASRYYAQIVDRQKVDRVDWRSSEKMREIPGYRWGVVVNYNMERPTRGGGSCIFLHQWSGPTTGTAGCTAMASRDIETLVRWLADEKQSVLVQLPKSEYQRLRSRWWLR